MIECQTGQAGGNTYGSSHGLVTVKLVQFVGFVVNRLIIQSCHQQLPTAMNQITLLQLTKMQAGSLTSTTSEHHTVDATEGEAMAQTEPTRSADEAACGADKGIRPRCLKTWGSGRVLPACSLIRPSRIELFLA